MSQIILAIYDSGVFRPLQPVDLAEGTRAQVIPTSSPHDANGGDSSWPAGYFEQTAGALAGEKFERPLQGELPARDAW